MDANKVKEIEKAHVMQTYGRFDLVIDHGKGAYVYDADGKKYLDFIGGIACTAVGHGNKEVAKAVYNQINKLGWVSNLYYTEPQAVLAQKLSQLSGLSKVFFANSGAEANEAAIKLAKRATGKTDFVVCEHAFHGRTHATLSATWKEKYKTPFKPLVEGFTFVPYNDVGAIEAAITDKTAAVMVEPIQGEAGVIVPSADYLEKVKQVCSSKGILLILDEVQTGIGRTGKFFAYQHTAIKPDIVTLAKGLANGIPIGVCISDIEFGRAEHASTFGGNCVASAAALATIDYIEKNNLMENAVSVGEHFKESLSKLKKVKAVRGKGLIIGVDIDADAKLVADECLKEGLLLNNAAEHTLRFLPPLTITSKEADKAVKILKKVLNKKNG